MFYSRHLCRLDPWPEEVTRTFTILEQEPTVYHVMNGPSESRQGDIASPVTANCVAKEALERFGRIDTLVNNAGVFVGKRFTAYTDDDVVPAIMYLESAPFVTGEFLYVDGGQSAGH